MPSIPSICLVLAECICILFISSVFMNYWDGCQYRLRRFAVWRRPFAFIPGKNDENPAPSGC
ncbi:hypothetical protein KM92DES2_11598 [uncultured Desulfovibrio sp.]|uniref:Uncharacterized protein n=1 Tax=uncultured Desulfovibrio sp. TaxID=167968 RepID=A0A212JRG0_9BACT|nr:hypothetical protein KM92DES2_11598 [uncultured Desulfovibrio sp.]